MLDAQTEGEVLRVTLVVEDKVWVEHPVADAQAVRLSLRVELTVLHALTEVVAEVHMEGDTESDWEELEDVESKPVELSVALRQALDDEQEEALELGVALDDAQEQLVCEGVAQKEEAAEEDAEFRLL